MPSSRTRAAALATPPPSSDPQADESSDSDDDRPSVLDKPQPPVSIMDGWMLRGKVLTFKGHKRMQVARLRLLLVARARVSLKSPEEIEARAYMEGCRLQRFLHAQMAHYDLFRVFDMDINGTYLSKHMESKLLRALHDGLCDKVPASVLKITRKLTKRNRIAFEAYEEELAQFRARRIGATKAGRATVSEEAVSEEAATEEAAAEEAAVEQAAPESEADREFRLLENDPGARANLDLDRFFNHYFLTAGKPDNTKTNRALRLDGLTDPTEVIRRIKAIPGLCFSVTFKFAGSAVIVGFELNKVKALLEKINAAAIKEFDRQWLVTIKQHDDLVKRHRALADRKTLSLEDCGGTYVARWYMPLPDRNNSRSEGYIASIHILSAPIAKGRALIAAFDFGVCIGTMHLSEHPEVVDDLANGRYDADADPEETPETPQGKRKRPPTSAESAHWAKRHETRQTSAQVIAGNPGVPSNLILFASFRGRKTAEDDSRIFHVPRTGKLRFWEASYCRITGEVDLPGLGPVKLEGFKTSDAVTPEHAPKPWDSFSEIAFKRERQQARRNHEVVVISSDDDDDDEVEPPAANQQKTKKRKARGKKQGKSQEAATPTSRGDKARRSRTV